MATNSTGTAPAGRLSTISGGALAGRRLLLLCRDCVGRPNCVRIVGETQKVRARYNCWRVGSCAWAARATKRGPPVEALAFTSVAAFSLAVLVIGVHLLLLARRTLQAPELLLGLSFVITLIGNCMFIVALDTGVANYAWSVDLVQVGIIVVDIGVAFMALFNLRVYRRGSRIAAVLTWVLIACMIGSQLVTWALLDTVSRTLPAWYWPKYSFRALVYVWGAIEALRYHHLLTRRVRHGLADPVVANRFFLWGVASVLAVIMLTAFETGDFFGFQTATGDVLMIAASLVGAPAAVLYWVTFFAPARYRQLVIRRSRIPSA